MDKRSRFDELLTYNLETGLFEWRANKVRAKVGAIAGTKHSRGYWQLRVDGKNYLAHRVAWVMTYGRWPLPGLDIDHINGNRMDNRIANLREVTRSQNMENQKAARRNSSTGFLGVLRNHNRFAAHIRARGVTHYLGTFDTAEEAHRAYLAAKSNLHIQSVAADRGVDLEPATA